MLKCCGEKLSSSDSDEEYICVNVDIHNVSQGLSIRGLLVLVLVLGCFQPRRVNQIFFLVLPGSTRG